MTLRLVLGLVLLFVLPLVARGEDFFLHRFERRQLTDVYYSEGAGVGDINGDGAADVVYGPHWYAGPEFKTAREIYPAKPQNREGYADSFFNWVYDFNGDGRPDVLLVGLPGTPAFVFENPGPDGLGAAWKKHKVFNSVGNESPQFVNLVGDALPELVCTRDGLYGFVTVNREQPFGEWEFHAISEKAAGGVFAHGLGVGDVNGDGRQDILHAKGWLEQPAENALTARWRPHDAKFSSAYGGADMFAYDVDGDGDNDVITSEAAHDFGLSWYEQSKENGEVVFTRRPILGAKASENRYGLVFSELHAVGLADIDGDGLKDIITGKTYYSHHKGSPQWDAGAVVYWFKLQRNKDGVDWLPFQADGDSGVGRDLKVVDVNGDGLLDIVAGGMKGAHALLHQKQKVDQATFAKAQPEPKKFVDPPAAAPTKAITRRGPKAPIEKKTGKVIGALEGESLKFQVTGGKAGEQGMGGFALDQWSNNSQLRWTGGKHGNKLTLELHAKEGKVDVELVLSCARDYGIVKISLDGKPLGEPVDCYYPEVITTGVLTFEDIELKAGPHKLELEIVGANAKADKAYMVGVDYVRLKGEKDDFTSEEDGITAKADGGRVLNLDFETGTLEDWTATGKAFDGQPIKGDTVSGRRNDMSSGHAGKFWIGGYEKSQDPPKGTLTSVPFKVTQPWASYLANGGPHNETRIEIVLKAGDKVLHKSIGQESETMRPVVVDLKDVVGQEVYLRLVDEHTGHWGHLNFDHFRFHKTKPVAPVRVTPPALAADEYPHSGLTAAESVKAMKLPPGFKALVGAAEPDVKQPIAMAIDDRGRVWIAEAYEYPIRAKGDVGRDRILIFEDTDGDGTLDKHKVFKEGLNLVSGLEVGFGGVWVGAAPYLMFIPDANRDDVPDAEPKILLDGWGWQDTHETLNTFIWGPDGWLYGCHGVFTHSKVGKPGTPDKDRQPINAGVWRYHPLRHEFEVFAHGTSNPWGVDFNDRGQAFITACVIPHLFHIIDGARYQRQAGQHFNPHTYRDIVTIADHLHYLGATPHGGNNRSDSAGGGHAHAGAMIYLGGLWPAEYRDAIFMNNIHGQRINIDTLHAKGSGYVGSHGPDFLLTGDKASQILNLRYGPDGNAWVIDWYDMQACHTGNVGAHNRTNGRIYKVVYEGLKGAPVRPNALPVGGGELLAMSDLQLAELTLHSNDWYVRHARRLLQERAAVSGLNEAAVKRLTEIATSHADETRRLRAAWVLHVMNAPLPDLTEKLLTDASPYVRGWAIQLALETGKAPSDTLFHKFAELAAKDPSPVVRMYLASALLKLPPASRWNLLQSLASHREDVADHNLPLLYWYAAEPLAEADPERALAWAMSAGESIPLLREFMLKRIGSGDTANSLAILVRGLGKTTQPSVQNTFLGAIRAALKGQRQVQPPAEWAKVAAGLAKSNDATVRLQATALGVTFGDATALAALRERIVDRALAADVRRTALEALLDAKDPQLVAVLQTLAKEDSAIREVALRGLAQYADPQTAPLLLSLYEKLPAAEKRLALGTLASRADSGIALLKAVQAKQLPAADLTADVARQLENFKNEELQALLGSVWGTVRESPADKLAQIASYKTLAESKTHPPVDLALGRLMFAKTCQKCHTLYGVGQKIGPDLTGSNRANIDYLLSNIVDPSAVMAKEYQPQLVELVDGRIVVGLTKAEDDKSLTLQTVDTLLTIPKSEIEQRATSPKSMMPDDQLKQFSEHEVRSLIAYLQGKSQTPIRATADSAATLFNGKDLAGWSGDDDLWSVENGELVGKTSGLKHNEWIVNEQEFGDFKLTVEVKLVNNEGNSGIQFRSQARDHEVDGYQADIGAGWWGKLYEEHGRALLWDKSGEAHIKPGEWNTYEIRAVGDHVQTWLNGQPCVDLKDPKGAQRGILALQLHSGGKTEVRYRNFKLELLEPAAAVSETDGRRP